jgi:hypothetical protein
MRRPAKNSSTTVELSAFYSSLGALVMLGLNSIDLTTLYGRASRNPTYDIPYPFTRRTFPLRVAGPRESPVIKGGYSLLLKMNAKTFPDLAEHVINGEPIVPAAAFVDMVGDFRPTVVTLSFSLTNAPCGQVLQTGVRLIWDIEFGKILSLTSEVPLEVRIEHQGCKWSIKTSQVNADAKTYDNQVHSSGSSSFNAVPPLPGLDVQQTLAKFPLINIHGDSSVVLKYE